MIRRVRGRWGTSELEWGPSPEDNVVLTRLQTEVEVEKIYSAPSTHLRDQCLGCIFRTPSNVIVVYF
jgi:hypothetical protein